MGIKPTNFRLISANEITDDTELYSQKLNASDPAEDTKMTATMLKAYVALASLQKKKYEFPAHSGTQINMPGGAPTMPNDQTLVDVLMDGIEQATGDWSIDTVNNRINLLNGFTAAGEDFTVKYYFS